MGVLRYVFGESYFTAQMKDGARLLNLCMEYGIVYRGFGEAGEGRVGLYCSTYSSVALRRLCANKGIELTLVGSRGLPPLIYRHRNRVGLLIGAVLAVIMISLSDNYLWDVRVSGNESLTYSQVTDALREQGLTVGTPLGGLDVDKIKTRIMVENDRISWMAINVIGTVAHVQIRERVSPEPSEKALPANIVASRDGQIEYLEVYQGDAAVKVGQAVRKGDLLISGIRESRVDGFSVTRAAGSVYAVTEREIRVEVPYEYDKKCYTGEQKSEISIIFFGKELKVLKYSGNYGEFCDTIESEEMLSLSDGVTVPFGIRKVSFAEYTVSRERYTPEEAMEIAYYRLSERISAELSSADILRKETVGEIGESAYVLICRIKCVEDIGLVSEFETNLS